MDATTARRETAQQKERAWWMRCIPPGPFGGWKELRCTNGIIRSGDLQKVEKSGKI